MRRTRIGPNSCNNGSLLNRGRRISPEKLPQPVYGLSTGLLGMFRTRSMKAFLIDRGRRVTVLNQNEQQSSLVWRWPSRNTDRASRLWRRRLEAAGGQSPLFRTASSLIHRPGDAGRLRQHQLVANPLQIKAARLHAHESRLQNEATSELLYERGRRAPASFVPPAGCALPTNAPDPENVSRTRAKGQRRWHSDGRCRQDPGRPAILQLTIDEGSADRFLTG